MEISNLKHLQRYMTIFELDYRKFECDPQRHHLYTTFIFASEELFETLEIDFLGMTTAYFPTIVKPIVSRKFGNNFYHQNVPNQSQHYRKHRGQKYQYRRF